MPGLLLGDVFPDFEAETTVGKIKFHDFLGDSWGILFSHPRDYTPVCTTELGRAAKLSSEFSKRNVRMIALSIDCLEDHYGWSKVLSRVSSEKTAGDEPLRVWIDVEAMLCARALVLTPAVFIIGPDKKLKLSILYPATTGRNFDELLRVIDSLQLTAGVRVATPADWKPGVCVMVPPSMPEEEAASMFPAGVFSKELPSGRKYLRYTPQPKDQSKHTDTGNSQTEPGTTSQP
uniref:Thioredoxin domain-containing protein n=1 Tax=Nothobranchius furzeri TaxID=105023 RepID=A0A8C6LV07_NOTFU